MSLWRKLILKFEKSIYFSLNFHSIWSERGTYVKALCASKDLWPCSSMANMLTYLRPVYQILATSGSGEKNFISFLTLRLWEKIQFQKIIWSSPLISFFSGFRSKINKQGYDFGRASVWDQTWNIVKSTIEVFNDFHCRKV